jgi:hypothetical protein
MKRAPSLVLLLLASCATVGSKGEGDRDLPTAGVGPFRKLDSSELLTVAPFVLDDKEAQYRQPAALASEKGSTRVLLYAVTTRGGKDIIVRSRADDARSFYGTSLDGTHTPPSVLEPELPWEGTRLSHPAVVRRGDQIWLYYATDGGIGFARSEDGLHFTKSPAPVLARDPAVAWESTQLTAPSVAALPDGRLRMIYAAGGFLGEAESTDGASWRRLDADPATPAVDPILGPAAPVDPASLAPGEKPPFDTGAVGEPCLVPRLTVEGTLHFRVLYTGWDGPPGAPATQTAIGFAARHGDAGRLSRQPAPVYAAGKHEASPTMVELSFGTMLYVSQDRVIDSKTSYTAIAAALAPATARLTRPETFADGP